MCIALPFTLFSVSIAPGWLAIARARHATTMTPSHVLEAMPGIAAAWEVSGGGVIDPRQSSTDAQLCTGAKFAQSWQTASYFGSSDTGPAGTKFRDGDYEFMRDDARRTPLYYAAIRKRLAEADSPQVVLDLGTGACALLALEAARAGAKRVYAIEAQSDSAQSAREAVAAAGFDGVIEVIEGLSTEITLPEKVGPPCLEGTQSVSQSASQPASQPASQSARQCYCQAVLLSGSVTVSQCYCQPVLLSAKSLRTSVPRAHGLCTYYVPMCLCTHVPLCLVHTAYVHTSVPIYIPLCLLHTAYVHVCMHACASYLLTHLLTYLLTYLLTHLLTYLLTYLLTC